MTQLEPLAQEDFDVGRVLKIIDSQIENAVDASWLACFELWASGVQLALMLTYIALLAAQVVVVHAYM